MRWTVRVLGLVFVAAVAAVLVRTYRDHQARIAAQAARAAPVVAPSRVQDVGGEAMVFVEKCKDPKSVTIFVRGGTDHVVSEVERAVVDD